MSVCAQGREEASEPGVAGESCLSAQVDVAPARELLRESWTTAAGARTFLAHAAHFGLRPGGDPETRSNPDSDPGQQGGEGAVLPAVQPMAMLSFTWNAPSDRPAVGRPRTLAMVGLHAIGPHATRLRRTHDGWGRGDEWNRAQACIRRAGRRVVLPRLYFRSEHGARDGDQLSESLQPAAPGCSSRPVGPGG